MWNIFCDFFINTTAFTKFIHDILQYFYNILHEWDLYFLFLSLFCFFLNNCFSFVSLIINSEIEDLIILFFKILSNSSFVLAPYHLIRNKYKILPLYVIHVCLHRIMYFHSNCTETLIHMVLLRFSLYLTHNARSHGDIFCSLLCNLLKKWFKDKYMHIFILHFVVFSFYNQNCFNLYNIKAD